MLNFPDADDDGTSSSEAASKEEALPQMPRAVLLQPGAEVQYEWGAKTYRSHVVRLEAPGRVLLCTRGANESVLIRELANLRCLR